MKFFILSIVFAFSLFSAPLTLKDGFVAAHTEVLGDSTIDPLNTQLKADVSIDDTIESLKGKFWIDMNYFSSDNKNRDEHMNDATEVKLFPVATYTIDSVTKAEGKNNYTMTGKLNFHGVEKDLSFNGEMTQDTNTVTIKAKSSFLVSDYGIDMPCLLGFALCVDDKVELFVKASLNK